MGLTKVERRRRIKYRIRKRIFGNTECPRLSVFRSNKEIYAQIIDDTRGVTLVSYSSMHKDVRNMGNLNKSEKAKIVGKRLAEKALEKGIVKISFDRNGYLYHGRVKSLAEGAREGGLKF